MWKFKYKIIENLSLSVGAVVALQLLLLVLELSKLRISRKCVTFLCFDIHEGLKDILFELTADVEEKQDKVRNLINFPSWLIFKEILIEIHNFIRAEIHQMLCSRQLKWSSNKKQFRF